jgi:restriction system protein
VDATGVVPARRPGLLARVPALWGVPAILAVGDVAQVAWQRHGGDWIMAAAAFLALSALVGIPVSWRTEQLRRSGIDTIDQMDGLTFERRLGVLFKSLGWGRVEVTKASGDHGADLVLTHHGQRTVVQAKRYSHPVGPDAVYEVVQSMPWYRANRAMVVTNSTFLPAAKRAAAAYNVELVDRSSLIRLLAEQSATPAVYGVALLSRQIAAGAVPIAKVLAKTLMVIVAVSTAAAALFATTGGLSLRGSRRR